MVIAQNEQSGKGGVTLVLPIIEAERIKHRMTRDDLAQKLGVSKRTDRKSVV